MGTPPVQGPAAPVASRSVRSTGEALGPPVRPGAVGVEIFVQILVVLVLARLFGEAAERLGQSASVGELLAGMVLSLAGLYLASLTPWIAVLAELRDSAVLAHLGTLGIFFLVLMAGIEMKPKEIAETSKAAFLVALGGMLVPLAAGCALGWLILPEGPLKLPQALVIGVAMSITAIPATVKVLSEFDLLHSRLGETVVAAAVFDDVLRPVPARRGDRGGRDRQPAGPGLGALAARQDRPLLRRHHRPGGAHLSAGEPQPQADAGRRSRAERAGHRRPGLRPSGRALGHALDPRRLRGRAVFSRARGSARPSTATSGSS